MDLDNSTRRIEALSNPDCQNFMLPRELMHDLVQPINSIRLISQQLSDTLAQYLKQDITLLKNWELLQRAITIQEQMMHSLRVFWNTEHPKETESIQAIPLFKVFNEINSEISKPRDIAVRIDIPEDIIIMSNPQKCREILLNIYRNALQHAHSEVAIFAVTNNQEVCVHVVNNGLGIPSDVSLILGQAFVRSKKSARSQGALGLGLYLAAKQAETLDGHVLKIHASSKWQSDFSLTLPRAKASKPCDNSASILNAPLNGLTVLIIDNNEQSRAEFFRLLSSWGCKPLSTASINENPDLFSSEKNQHRIYLISKESLINTPDSKLQELKKAFCKSSLVILYGDRADFDEFVFDGSSARLANLTFAPSPSRLRSLMTNAAKKAQIISIDGRIDDELLRQ